MFVSCIEIDVFMLNNMHVHYLNNGVDMLNVAVGECINHNASNIIGNPVSDRS